MVQPPTFPQQVDVTVCQEQEERLQVSFHVPCTHPHHLGTHTYTLGSGAHSMFLFLSEKDPEHCPHLEVLLFVLSEDMDHEQEQVIVVHPETSMKHCYYGTTPSLWSTKRFDDRSTMSFFV